MPRRPHLALIPVVCALCLLALPGEAAPAKRPKRPAPKAAPQRPAPTASVNERLVRAIQAGDAAKVTQLLAAGASPNYKDTGMPVVVAAAMGGHTAVLKVLLEKGADPKATTPDGMDALSAATFSAKPADLLLLLDHGAEVDARSGDGQTALFSAFLNLENLKLLLARGADPNAMMKSGPTALVMFCEMGDPALSHLEAIKLLVEKGADVNGRAKPGEALTPLQSAAKQGTVDVVKFLLKSGADINRPGAGNATPLMMAALKAQLEVVRELLAAGADVKPQAVDGGTAFLLAFATDPARGAPEAPEVKRRLQIAQLLLDKGADVNGRVPPEGQTVLIVAAQFGEVELVKFLLAHQADPSLQTKDGTAALKAAVKGKHPEIVRLLKAAGAQ